MPGGLGFVGPTYQSENPTVDAERVLNLYPEVIESGHGPSPKSGMAYYHTPGTTLFKSGLSSPVRALWSGNNTLFVLAGANLYDLNPVTGAIIATYTLAMPAGAGPGQIVFVPSGPGLTGASSGALLVWDGSSGFDGTSTYNNVWYVDGTTSTPPAVISGVGIGVIDGYAVVLRPGCSAAAGAADPLPITTIDQTQFNLSAIFLANSYDPLQFAIKTGAGDALQSVFTPGSIGGGGPEELWLFGQKTIEVWYDTGGSSLDPFPFQRVPGAFINEGQWASFAVAMANNMPCFLGGDDRGVGVVWAMNGYTPQRISNHAVEMAFQTYQTAGNNLSNAIMYTYQENGHMYLVLTFPGSGGRTFVADFSCQDASGRPMWHERARGSSLTALSPSWMFHTWTSGHHFVAGDGTGNVYVSSLAVYQDNGSAILRARVGPSISNENAWLRHGQFWLAIGGPFSTSRTFLLDWSNDGGETYGNQFSLSVQQEATTGFGRVLMNNLGRSRQRNYRVQTTDDEPQSWIDAYVVIP
jgi:hypothetical protein